MNFNIKQIDHLNCILIVLSFAIACFLPFEIFLLAYAILGPLHYLTETNWIADKNYFVINKSWKYFVIIAAIIYSIPYFFCLPFFAELFEDSTQLFISQKLSIYTNSILFFILVSSIFVLFYKTYKAFVFSFLIVLLISFKTYSTEAYTLIYGLLLPTIIHVYFFTILFMIYGTKKKMNRVGVLNIALMIILPLSLLFLNTDIFNYQFTNIVKETYVANNFHALNANIAKILGVYEGLKFFFYEKVDLKIQIFISFAYIYHYLNWFSKTTVIGWHKKLTTKKTVIILVTWVTIIGCYIYDYRFGLVISIFLSVLHVMLEFPLNIISIKSLFKKT